MNRVAAGIGVVLAAGLVVWWIREPSSLADSEGPSARVVSGGPSREVSTGEPVPTVETARYSEPAPEPASTVEEVPPAVLTLRCVDPDGVPLPGTAVTWVRAAAAPPPAIGAEQSGPGIKGTSIGTSDAEGHLVYSPVSPELLGLPIDLTLEWLSDDFSQLSVARVKADPMSPGETRDLGLVEVGDRRGSAIEGKVFTETYVPVPRVEVHFFPVGAYRSWIPHQIFTSALGTFSVRGLQPVDGVFPIFSVSAHAGNEDFGDVLRPGDHFGPAEPSDRSVRGATGSRDYLEFTLPVKRREDFVSQLQIEGVEGFWEGVLLGRGGEVLRPVGLPGIWHRTERGILAPYMPLQLHLWNKQQRLCSLPVQARVDGVLQAGPEVVDLQGPTVEFRVVTPEGTPVPKGTVVLDLKPFPDQIYFYRVLQCDHTGVVQAKLPSGKYHMVALGPGGYTAAQKWRDRGKSGAEVRSVDLGTRQIELTVGPQ